ncbi:hypothetical protein BJV78DRAFT_869954 [Lactifluus subvellereus]|nr:hypothetical protein BJV78DRAFT_869954 [Lactifluus subvellereus]
MRRIASVLSQRRPDKHPPDDVHPDPTSSKQSPSSLSHRRPSRRFFGTLTRITVSTDPPNQPLESAHSSASSTGSVSLRTPEDGSLPHVAQSPSIRKSWISWFAPKKSDLQGQSQLSPPSYLSDSLSAVTLPPAPPTPSRIIASGQLAESDDDTSEDSSSSESEGPLHPPPAPRRRDTANRQLSPIDFLSALTTNSIPPSFSSPPLLLRPDVPIFPRSSNPSRSLPFRNSVESTMHKKRLLHRLQQEPHNLADRRLLASLGSRAPSAAQRRPLLQPEEGERYDLMQVRSFSLGLKRWIARPYFEERTVVWAPDEAGTVVWTTVNGSGFGVWALEVSGTLEVLAGLINVDDVLPMGAPPPTNNSPLPSTSIPAVGKHVPYKGVPSPLRYDRGFSEPPTPTSTPEVMTPTSTSTVSSSRRGVRFAESVDDREDQVPLGYILRHRKRREEKALFLQREQERRGHEEERIRHEAERQQWEQEKRRWQKERRVVEEAKRQKQYAEEITAARVRRQSLYGSPSSQAREQDSRPREAYARPTYDPRRQTEYSSQARPPRPRDDSPSSSKLGSLLQSESVDPPASRSDSMHSISSDDARTRISRNNKRASMISDSSQRSMASPMFAYGWQPVPPVSQAPQIPVFPSMPVMAVMPQFTMDMPLLPPTAPFMRQQYGRPSSRSRDSSQSKSTGQSRSAERPQRSNDRASPPSRHHRSNSDDRSGRNSPPRTLTPTSNTLSPSAYPSHRVSMSSPMKPYPVRRRTAIS